MERIETRMRDHLIHVATLGDPISYQALAVELNLSPPQTIQQVTNALEVLMAEDVATGRPMIAALVISRSGTGLPAVGFFETAARLGRFDGDWQNLCNNHDAKTIFWRTEFAAVLAHINSEN